MNIICKWKSRGSNPRAHCYYECYWLVWKALAITTS